MRFKFNILVAVLFINNFVYSQLQVKNFFTLTGKRDNPVNVVCQDHQGFLIFGTNSGIYKFNGKTATEIHSTNQILKQPISALNTSVDGTIWVGTRNGKVYSLRKNKIDSLNLGPKNSGITSFYKLDSLLFIGTYGNGLFVKTPTRLLQYNSTNGLSDNVVYKISGNDKNFIWCGTDGGISEIELKNNKFDLRTISDINGLPDNIVKDIQVINNKLLIAMLDSGVCYYLTDKKKFIKHPQLPNWQAGTIINCNESELGRLIIGSEKNSLITIVNGQKTEYNYNTYIQTNSINQLFIDNSGQIWLASKNGLSHFVAKRFNLINNIKGFSDDKILAISINKNNIISVGTYKGISTLSNGPGATMAMNVSYDFSKYTISCAAVAPNGDTWYGSYGNGLIVINQKTGKSVSINSQNSELSNDNISNIYFSEPDVVYISTLGGGLIKGWIIDNVDHPLKINKTYTEADGLGSSYIYSALTDNAGKLYIASDGGGLQYLENGHFFNLLPKFKKSSSTVFSLCKDKFNNIWGVTNADGLIKFTGKALTVYNLEKGLKDLQPQQIIAVDSILYAFNSKGLDKINCVTGNVSHNDLFDLDLEPNLNAVTFNNGKIYSGTNNGILIYQTLTTPLDTIKPNAIIKALQINYKPFPVDSLTVYDYKQNNIAIEFDGVWLKAPEKLTFRYKLSGIEDNWIYSNESKFVNYNNLEPGDYTFMVQAKNEEDIWSNTISQQITILTPIWKRWWFWILIIVTTIALIYLLFKYRLKNLQRENLLLEQRVAERTSEIEEQSKIIEAKNKSLEQLSLVASKTDNGVLILDAEGKPEYVNEGYIHRNNLSDLDLEKLYMSSIYNFSKHPSIDKLINEAVTEKKAVHYETKADNQEKINERWESTTLTPIFGDEGELRKMIIIDTDISEIKKQEKIIRQKNKDITDSISYAKKIQHAILPRDSVIRSKLPNAFVLYMTKDIVSGDFYWFTHFNDFSIIAAVDCTGHGVPGAFMSIIGYSLLNRTINEKKITKPDEILAELNEGVLNILHKKGSESNDGMDMAICKINHTEKTLEFAGAMRPLWKVNNGQLTEIKGDKLPIGTKQKEEKIAYTNHTVTVNTGDYFYIFTDGYCDQFGGQENRKFSSARFKNLLISYEGLDNAQKEKNLRDEHTIWKGKNFQVDDILVIGFSV